MRTRVIQNEPEDPRSPRSSSAPPEAEPHSTEQAGWIGRWSPRQRRIAIWAALAAVVLGAAYLVTRPGSDTPAANGAGADAANAVHPRLGEQVVHGPRDHAAGRGGEDRA